MSVALKELLAHHLECCTFYQKMYGSIISQQTTLKSTVPTLENLIDCAYLCKESARILDDLRKEYTRLQELTEKIACAIAVNNGDVESIRGIMATGTPDIKMAIKLPSKTENPVAYKKLLMHLGFSVDCIDKDLASIQWKKLTEMVTEQMAAGKPAIPGVNPEDTYPIYRLRLTPYEDPRELERRIHAALEAKSAELRNKNNIELHELEMDMLQKRPTTRIGKKGR